MNNRERRDMQKRLNELMVFAICAMIFGCVLLFFYTASAKENARLETIADAAYEELLDETPPLAVKPVINAEHVAEYIEPEPLYGFTNDEIYLLAQLLCGDGRTDGDGEYDIDFMREVNHFEVSKVLCVVMNRVNDDRFPDTVEDVVLESGQFIVFPDNLDSVPSNKAIAAVKEWCDAYDEGDIGAQVIPYDHIYFTGNGVTNTTRS